MDKSVIEKIKKLMDIANSNSKNEAEIALLKMQELITKYNIDMQSLEDIEYEESEIKTIKRCNIELLLILNILSDYYFVVPYCIKKRVYKKIFFYGRKENIEISKYVFIFLYRTFNKLWSEYRKNKKGSSKKSYMYGLYISLNNTLKSQKDDIKKTGLIVINKKINDKKKEIQIKGKGTRVSILANGDFENGIHDGKNIKIRTPLKNKNIRSIK